jgi:hypothetical protein
MIVLGENEIDHVPLLFRIALRTRPAGQVFPELAFRTLRNFHGRQLHGSGLLKRGEIP